MEARPWGHPAQVLQEEAASPSSPVTLQIRYSGTSGRHCEHKYRVKKNPPKRVYSSSFFLSRFQRQFPITVPMLCDPSPPQLRRAGQTAVARPNQSLRVDKQHIL